MAEFFQNIVNWLASLDWPVILRFVLFFLASAVIIILIAAVIVLGFGWAKPVPINPNYYRGHKGHKMILVSAAGPLMNLLEAREVYVSKSSACKKGGRSHVLEAIGLKNEVIDGALRIGLSRFTTEEDIEALVSGLREARDTLAHR